MVFESIVVEILNRLLGDYFENLDTSQLSLGIWGGDVVLKDLLLKGSAMDDLDLPFKVVVGKVGSLQMKIPWSSLYTSPVEMSLKDLLLLVTPSYTVKYNEEAEEKAAQQGKQKEILRLDEIRARERKRQKEGGEAQQEDTFTEKLVTQIIKNVQIRVESIHIRYEDNVTKQSSPFAFGAVLKSLYVETTNGNWVPSVITEMVETVNKMATLDGLAIYWNSKTTLLQENGDKGEIIKALKDTFTKERANLSYILGPISSVVKILLTPNPERGDIPFSKPKFLVDVVLEELGLGMTNLQFQDIMELIQALDYMERAQNFRKYRPPVNIHQGHYKEWWRFAYSCILEETIRRKRQNWDWHHIVRHRRLVRLYTDAYYKKLTTKKLKEETTQTLSVCEKELDVFNITLVRKQVEVKIEREGKEREENKNKGWFSGFSSYFSKEQSSQSTQGVGEIVRKFEDALTPKEKAKLYKAIDYSENALPLDYPETYLEYKLNFELRKLVFNVSNAKHGNASTRSILRLIVDMLETRIATRPVRNGMQVNVTMKSFNAEGMKGKRDAGIVNIVTSRKRDETVHLLDVHFENNPLNSHVSQKVKVIAQPIEMIYHGKTVINLAKCFALPPEIQLSKLQAAAVATFNEWKEVSKTGLQHLLDTREEIDLHINLLAPYIIIPSEGVYNANSSNLIVDFGELKVKSLPRKRSLVPGKKEERMVPSLSYGSEEEYIDTMKKHAYDTLVIEFCDFQVMQTLPGESLSLGKSSSLASTASSVPQSLVKSDLLVFHLQQSLVPDDPRFPKFQVEGNLPILNLDLSEYRMIELVRILVTLPLPEDTPDGSTNASHVGQPLSTIEEDPAVSESLALIQLTYDTTDKKVELKEEQKLVECTDMVLKFGIESIRIIISKGSDEAERIPIMDFELKQIHAKLMAKTFSTSIHVGVVGLTLCALQNRMVNFEGPLYILKTPMTEGIEKHLLNVNMYSISPNCPPQFAGKVKQFITAEISCLDIILHLEAIQKLITFGVKISSIMEASAAEKERNSGGDNISISSDTSSLGAGASPSKGRTRKMSKQFQKIEATRKAIAKHHNEDGVLLQIDAKLGSLSIQFSSEKQNLNKADLRISPMSITVVLNNSEEFGTLIDINISDIFVRMTAGTLELLLKIFSTTGSAAANQGGGSKDLREEKDYSTIWQFKKNDDMNFWFLNPEGLEVEVGMEAIQVQEDKVRLFKVAEDLKVKERLLMKSGCIVFTVETGLGNNTMPMLLIEMDMDLQMFDWTTNMSLEGRLKMEAAYYNPTFGLWEYLIEPVESRNHGRVAHQPWELLFELSNRANPNAKEDNGEEGDNPSNSFTSITLESSALLELTVTKTALEKLLALKGMSTAAAYCVMNDTGSDLKIIVKERNKQPYFTLVHEGVDYDEVILKHGTSVNLGLIEAVDLTKHHTSVLREQEGKGERLLRIEIADYSFKRDIPVNRAAIRYYSLELPDTTRLGLICDVWVKDFSKIITFRGVVQIVNHLPKDIDIYCKQNEGSDTLANLAGTAIAGQTFNLPIQFTQTRTGDLLFSPEGFKLSNEAYSWVATLREHQKVTQITCRSKHGSGHHFYIKASGEAKQALHEGTNRKNIATQSCVILLEPPLVIHNMLPVSIAYYYGGPELITTERGHSLCITNIRVEIDGECKIKFKIPDYNKMSWICEVSMDKSTPDISQWDFVSQQDEKLSHTVGIHREVDEDNTVILHIYSPYWMLNRTGLELIYKGDDKNSHQSVHPRGFVEPILFSFSGKAFHRKKAAYIKVRQESLTGGPAIVTDWSEKFSLDVAGSSGFVTCKHPNGQFYIGVEIQLSSWTLTKYIMFTPRYYVVNESPFDIQIMEEGLDQKISKLPLVGPNHCIPIYPKSSTSHLIARVQIDGTYAQTKPFRYDMIRHTLLELKGRLGGIHVDVHYSEAKIVVTFTKFIPGQAPALLVNDTLDCPMEFGEEGCEEMFVLRPNMCQLFTWNKPLGTRILQWSAVGADKPPQGSDGLISDGCGSFESDGNVYFWVSFLDGLQRTLLFTRNIQLTSHLQAGLKNEVASAEYIVMLHGIGLSLVDNEKLREILYMRIASSEISWESSKPGKKKRFRSLTPETNRAIELAYQHYLNQKAIQANAKTNVLLDVGIEIDFATMMISKPELKAARRIFQNGIWIHYKTFPHSIQFHAKVNRLQIDNQLADSVFRVVFAPVPPKKTISSREFPKPFVEISIMERINAHSYVKQYKYFKILVQEFQLKIDIMFINGLVELFSISATDHDQRRINFMKDYDEVCIDMEEVLAMQILSQGQKHFYDFLHFSPIKLHLSFSMGGTAQVKNNLLNLILRSVGVTLTEIHDVIFKLSCLEFNHTFLSGEQLYNEVYSHYSSQTIKQLYVLVLGLDVLGNPYGLAVGFVGGVEAFFYEPIQGAIQGPGEFAEGLSIGVKKFFSSTVGGTAGAFSKITGTIGKGIAALTMDEEFQKKRRESIKNRGDGIRLARSGRGLVMGFVDGITGVVAKPVQGAREEGFKGFFKGVGKAAIGLVIRPVAGVVDFASGSLDAVKKCASPSVEVHRMRPPRLVPIDSVLQPYVRHEAEGVQLLRNIEKGVYGKTDLYVAHALINPQGKFVILLTDKRILYLKRNDMCGGWNTEWTHLWEDFSQPPDLVERGLLFILKELPKKKCSQIIGGGIESNDILVPMYSPEVCTWILNKVDDAMKLETGMMQNDGEEAEEAAEFGIA